MGPLPLPLIVPQYCCRLTRCAAAAPMRQRWEPPAVATAIVQPTDPPAAGAPATPLSVRDLHLAGSARLFAEYRLERAEVRPRLVPTASPC